MVRYWDKIPPWGLAVRGRKQPGSRSRCLWPEIHVACSITSGIKGEFGTQLVTARCFFGTFGDRGTGPVRNSPDAGPPCGQKLKRKPASPENECGMITLEGVMKPLGCSKAELRMLPWKLPPKFARLVTSKA